MKSFLIYLILRVYFFVVFLTCSWRVKGENVLLKSIKKDCPVMLCCWHERLVFLVCYFKHFKYPIWVVSSEHNDSEVLARILKLWNFKFIKGSSTRGWFSVTKKLLTLFKKTDVVVAITNDGPKGPPKIAKTGSFSLAYKNKVQLVGMSASATRFWTLNTWDKIKIPKPFSTITVGFYKQYSGKNNINDFNDYLNNNQKKIDSVL